MGTTKTNLLLLKHLSVQRVYIHISPITKYVRHLHKYVTKNEKNESPTFTRRIDYVINVMGTHGMLTDNAQKTSDQHHMTLMSWLRLKVRDRLCYNKWMGSK